MCPILAVLSKGISFMFARFRNARNPMARIFAFMSLIWVAACEPVGVTQPTNVGGEPQAEAGVQVALLVPGGSGSSSDELVARNLENAARLAIADLNGPDIRLRVYNTGGSPALAANVARQAVNDGAKIILGPLFGEAANAAGVAVADRNVNVLAFSNNPTIAGGNVFILGATFGNTANRLIQYGSAQGLTRYHIVHAQDPGAIIGRDAITAAARSSGGEIVGTSSYGFSQAGITSASPQIASDVAASGAQAVFLTADAGADLSIIADSLPEAGLTPDSVRYVGLTRWDSAQVAALPGLQGGLFAMPDQGRNALFANRYAATYGQSPHPLAGLAYDGIAAIGALVESGGEDALTRSALTTPQGFQGTSGVFRFLSNGQNQRALAVATIRNNQVAIVDQAPTNFRAGF